jgi:hypothetical protein
MSDNQETESNKKPRSSFIEDVAPKSCKPALSTGAKKLAQVPLPLKGQMWPVLPALTPIKIKRTLADAPIKESFDIIDL